MVSPLTQPRRPHERPEPNRTGRHVNGAPAHALRLTGLAGMVEQELEHWLDQRVDTATVRRRLAHWGCLPGDLSERLDALRADATWWLAWSERACERCSPSQLCTSCREQLYRWHDVRREHVVTLMRAACEATGVIPAVRTRPE